MNSYIYIIRVYAYRYQIWILTAHASSSVRTWELADKAFLQSKKCDKWPLHTCIANIRMYTYMHAYAQMMTLPRLETFCTKNYWESRWSWALHMQKRRGVNDKKREILHKRFSKRPQAHSTRTEGKLWESIVIIYSIPQNDVLFKK